MAHINCIRESASKEPRWELNLLAIPLHCTNRRCFVSNFVLEGSSWLEITSSEKMSYFPASFLDQRPGFVLSHYHVCPVVDLPLEEVNAKVNTTRMNFNRNKTISRNGYE